MRVHFTSPSVIFRETATRQRRGGGRRSRRRRRRRRRRSSVSYLRPLAEAPADRVGRPQSRQCWRSSAAEPLRVRRACEKVMQKGERDTYLRAGVWRARRRRCPDEVWASVAGSAAVAEAFHLHFGRPRPARGPPRPSEIEEEKSVRECWRKAKASWPFRVSTLSKELISRMMSILRKTSGPERNPASVPLPTSTCIAISLVFPLAFDRPRRASERARGGAFFLAASNPKR